uniref:Uncharacterized protein n=1 Tax=Oryza sativa subsp. japonica TaxID=39947 RepID=Q5JCW1_ORYSJ|nr:hypothetical protein [Oryza sativa Japonica Group]
MGATCRGRRTNSPTVGAARRRRLAEMTHATATDRDNAGDGGRRVGAGRRPTTVAGRDDAGDGGRRVKAGRRAASRGERWCDSGRRVGAWRRRDDARPCLTCYCRAEVH